LKAAVKTCRTRFLDADPAKGSLGCTFLIVGGRGLTS
jgi:hypothetical protein